MKYGISLVAIWLLTIAACATHIVYCFQHDRWGFLIVGALAFPIAIVHGVLIWFGAV